MAWHLGGRPDLLAENEGGDLTHDNEDFSEASIEFCFFFVNGEKCVLSVVDVICPLVVVVRVWHSVARVSAAQVFAVAVAWKMFWRLLPGPLIGGHLYTVPPIRTKEWEEQKAILDKKTGRIWPNVELSARVKLTREFVVKQFWTSFVEDKFDLENAIQTKAELSHAISVMGRICGWEGQEGEQENWVGPRFAASMWIHTLAVVRNGQNYMQNFRFFKLRSVMEAVNWVCDDALDEHVWVSEQTISLQDTKVLEAVQYDSLETATTKWDLRTDGTSVVF